jgi:hypothetical protein
VYCQLTGVILTVFEKPVNTTFLTQVAAKNIRQKFLFIEHNTDFRRLLVYNGTMF